MIHLVLALELHLTQTMNHCSALLKQYHDIVVASLNIIKLEGFRL